MLIALLWTAVWALATAWLAYRAARRGSSSIGLPFWAAVAALFGIGLLAYVLSAAIPARALAIDTACIGLAMALWTDIRWTLMFDVTTYTTFVATFAIVVGSARSVVGLESTLLGSAIIAGFFGLFFVLSGGRAMGLGDVKIGLSIGAALGLTLVPTYLACTSAVCLVVGVALLLMGRRGEIAFGPYVAAGMALTVGFGSPVSHFLGGQ